VNPYQDPAHSGLHIKTYFTNIPVLLFAALCFAAVFIEKEVNHCDVICTRKIPHHMQGCLPGFAFDVPGRIPRASQQVLSWEATGSKDILTF
jgi:hypothetical protein